MAMMSKLQAAYLAGLIDGEGYIGILRTQKNDKAHCTYLHEHAYCPVLKIAMTDRSIIEWLYSSFGGTFEIRRARENARESYGWTCRKALVGKFLRYLYPYLRVKRKQAEIIFRYPQISPGTKISEDVYGKRGELYLSIRALNKVGTVRD